MKNFTKFTLALCALMQFSCTSSTESFDVEKLLTTTTQKVKEVGRNYQDYSKLPRCIDEGDIKWKCVPYSDWTSGFYPGILWYGYEYTQDAELLKSAQGFTNSLRPIAYSPARIHDIGFQIYCSYGNGYRLTGDEDYKSVMLAAADTLATLYNPNVGTIHSWPYNREYPHNTIIDNMMNLELMFWAAKNGGDQYLEDIAVSHAEVTQKYIVRPDFSTYHLGSFDDQTGEFLGGYAHQGYADDSMWARGQAWGIYGFAVCYREVGREDFLNTSMKLADKFMSRLPEDGVPFWDYDDLAIPNAPKDASASAVAACGMLELSQLLEDEKLAKQYYGYAVDLIKAISTDEYISGVENEALLLHSTGHHPRGWEIDVPIIYADYYYLEALLRLKKIAEK